MSVPVETDRVMKVLVADDTLPAARKLIIQGFKAVDACVVTNAAGVDVWTATAAGEETIFDYPIEIKGINVTGTGPVYVYLA